MTVFLFDYLYIAPLALTAISYYNGLTGMEAPAALIYAVTTAVTLVLTILAHLRLKERLMLIGIMLASIAGVYLALVWAHELIHAEDYHWLMPVMLIAFFSYIAGSLMARFSYVRIGVSLLAFVMLGLTLFGIIAYPGLSVFFAIFLIIVSAADEVHIRWRRDGFTDEKTHMVCAASFIASIVIIAAFIRYPERPYDWKLFIDIYEGALAAADRISFGFGAGEDGIVGFSEDGRLLSGLGNISRDVLSVNTDSDIEAPLYLAGIVSDSFDGHGWKQIDDSLISARNMDAIEGTIAMRAYSEDYRDLYREEKIRIDYMDVKSKYLFAPSKLTSVNITSGKENFTERGGTLVFKRYNPYHFSVNERFIRLNTESADFYDFMRDGAALDKLRWSSTISYDSYLKYKEHVKGTYSEEIQLSDELSARLEAIYDGAGSEYEKLKRLEASFQKMKYSLNPPEIPDYVSDSSGYLDYFLLDSGEGYCSYYATAFALLARAEGLPARYVQGYRVDIDKKGTYTVTSDMAHAWPEVYFEGKGWVAFEPTPGFYRGTAWGRGDEGDAVIPGVPSVDPVFLEADTGEIEETDEVYEKADSNISIILLPVVLMLFFIMAFFILNRLIQKRSFKGLSDQEKLKAIARDNLAILGFLGYRLADGETLDEYRQRIANGIGADALGFITDYEEALYSDLPKSAIKPDTALVCNERLTRLLKERKRFKYMLRLLAGYNL